MQSRRPAGFAFALASAASFGVSGIFASALLDSGWSSSAVATVRIGGVALVGLRIASVTGILPFEAADLPVLLSGRMLPVWVAIVLLVLIATASAYVLGILGGRRFGATLASFVGYSEPMFGILWTASLLWLLPTPLQGLGAAAIIAGVMLVRIGQSDRSTASRSPNVVEGVPSR